jgi:hypothetical protein
VIHGPIITNETVLTDNRPKPKKLGPIITGRFPETGKFPAPENGLNEESRTSDYADPHNTPPWAENMRNAGSC